MASYTVVVAKHATLTANTVDTVNLPAAATVVEVLNRDGTAEIYFTIDGNDPAVAGDDTNVLPAAMGSLEVGSPLAAQTVVKLISSGTPKYTVRVLS